jgi:hypothetical protein
MNLMKKFICVLISSLMYFQSLPGLSLAHATEGNQSTSQTTQVEFSDQGVIQGAEFLSVFVVWAAALVSMMIIELCLIEGAPCGIGAISAGLAGAALLAGEIIAIVDYQKSVNSIAVNLRYLRKYKDACDAGKTIDLAETNGVDPCDQMESLKAQKKSFEKMKSALETKGAMYLAAAAAYTFASIVEAIAAGEESARITNLIQSIVTCETTARTQAAAYSAPAQATMKAQCEACAAACSSAGFLATTFEAHMNNPAPSGSMATCTALREELRTIGNTIYNGCNAGTCAASATQAMTLQTQMRAPLDSCAGTFCTLGCTRTPVSVTSNRNIPESGSRKYSNYFNKFIAKIISSANAEGGTAQSKQSSSDADNTVVATSIFKYAGVAVALLLGLTKTWADQLDKFFGTPVKRSLIFLVMAALTGGFAGYTLGPQMDVVKRNIEKIDKILNMSGTIKGKTAISTSSAISIAGITYNFDENQELQLLENPDQRFPCINGGDGKGNCLDGQASHEFTLQRLNLGSLAGVASSVQTLERSMSGQRRINSQGLGAARALAQAHSKLRKQLNLVHKQYNDKMQAQGSATMDFDGESQKILSSISGNARELLNKNGGESLKAQIAANLPAQTPEQMEKKLSGEEVAKFNTTESVTQALADPMSWTLDVTEDQSPSGIEINPEKDFSQSTVKDEGIVDNKNASIFEVISIRYLKSAFSRLFEEEK